MDSLCSSLQTVDSSGIAGYDQVEKVARCLIKNLQVCQAEERRCLTLAEAEELSAQVQLLQPCDRQSTFSPRAKKAKATGRYRSKKGSGNQEVETCAR